jgi:hypothetical protein
MKGKTSPIILSLVLITVLLGCNARSIGANAEQRGDVGVVSRIQDMTASRAAHTATLLPDGRVLITGGLTGLASTEIFDPTTETFTPAGNLSVARAGHSATLLSNGKVLIAGGYNGSYLASAELYDPVAKRFTPASAMTAARSGHVATLGYHENSIVSSNAWVYRG